MNAGVHVGGGAGNPKPCSAHIQGVGGLPELGEGGVGALLVQPCHRHAVRRHRPALHPPHLRPRPPRVGTPPHITPRSLTSGRPGERPLGARQKRAQSATKLIRSVGVGPGQLHGRSMSLGRELVAMLRTCSACRHAREKPPLSSTA